MKQNINLLPQRAGSSGDQPALGVVAASWGVVLVIVIAAQWWLGSAVDKARRDGAQLRAQVAAAEEQLNNIAAAQMAGSDTGLEAELSQLLAELDLRETVLELVSGGAAGYVDGFSAQIRSLAQQQTEGVWLTRVAVVSPGARTTIEGKAISPEFVPMYLRGLSQQQALAGQRFDRFEISRPEDPGDTVVFALNHVRAGEGETQ